MCYDVSARPLYKSIHDNTDIQPKEKGGVSRTVLNLLMIYNNVQEKEEAKGDGDDDIYTVRYFPSK